MSRVLGRLLAELAEASARWGDWRQERRDRRTKQRQENRLLQTWATTELVAELRRHNELMGQALLLLSTFLQPTSQEAGGDNSPVEIDEQQSVEELMAELTDEQLDRLARGEELSEEEGGGIDRVEDGGE